MANLTICLGIKLIYRFPWVNSMNMCQLLPRRLRQTIVCETPLKIVSPVHIGIVIYPEILRKSPQWRYPDVQCYHGSTTKFKFWVPKNMMCNIQSKICDHSMYISIKKHPEICPILEFFSESGVTQCSRKRWASVCYWMPESRRDRCQTQILWHMMLKIPKKLLDIFF